MKPLVKYPGGKYNEYNKFKDFIPNTINNYYEPFFGGGGVFFRLKEENLIQGKSYINDFSKSLIDFYKSISDNDFRDELYKLSNSWERIKKLGDSVAKTFSERFKELIERKEETAFINEEMHNFIAKWLLDFELNMHGFSLLEKIEDSLNKKLKRFQNIVINDEINLVIYKCITTSICQAFYFIIRDMYNDWNNSENNDKYSSAEKSAQWVFIREFCFGSMFRFGADGNFNIPYGGFSYNKKCFDCKIKNIFSEDAEKAFSNVDIKNCDFEDAINSWEFGVDDFMFLDPPYDSTFTEYDENSFNKSDHLRLYECLKKCKCKWMIVIRKTDFICDIYKDFYISEYDKTYSYQARGKYDGKHTTHLLITNYKQEKVLQ